MEKIPDASNVPAKCEKYNALAVIIVHQLRVHRFYAQLRVITRTGFPVFINPA